MHRLGYTINNNVRLLALSPRSWMNAVMSSRCWQWTPFSSLWNSRQATQHLPRYLSPLRAWAWPTDPTLPSLLHVSGSVTAVGLAATHWPDSPATRVLESCRIVCACFSDEIGRRKKVLSLNCLVFDRSKNFENSRCLPCVQKFVKVVLLCYEVNERESSRLGRTLYVSVCVCVHVCVCVCVCVENKDCVGIQKISNLAAAKASTCSGRVGSVGRGEANSGHWTRHVQKRRESRVSGPRSRAQWREVTRQVLCGLARISKWRESGGLTASTCYSSPHPFKSEDKGATTGLKANNLTLLLVIVYPNLHTIILKYLYRLFLQLITLYFYFYGWQVPVLHAHNGSPVLIDDVTSGRHDVSSGDRQKEIRK